MAQYNMKQLTGQVFTRLTVLGRFPHKKSPTDKNTSYWKCECVCGKTIFVGSHNLLKGLTRSCGCLQKDAARANFQKATEARTIRDPKTATAHTVFREEYSDGDLTFEDFLTLSQENCYYCGMGPSNCKRAFGKNNSQHFKDNCEFTYSGLDRVDNTQPHHKANVVPCCHPCNWAKSDLTESEFMAWATRITKHIFDDGNLTQMRKTIQDLSNEAV